MSKTVENVVVFGATGQTGLCSIERALSKGYYALYFHFFQLENHHLKKLFYVLYEFIGAKVTALVRDLSRLPEDLGSKINVIHGNSTVKEDVMKAVQGQDAVIVALGTRHDLSITTKT